jgi:putative ATP-dependent endonuclease of OLD family
MKIYSVLIENFRPFKKLEEMRTGSLATIVGKNDVGKSNILKALQIFFEDKPKIDENDVHSGSDAGTNIIVEVAFNSLPERVELEAGVETTLQEEMLVDGGGHLRIHKNYLRDNLTKFEIVLVTRDFIDNRFSGLLALKEKELNERCIGMGIDVTKSGRGITNKSKRGALREKARELGIQVESIDIKLSPKDDLWKAISALLPEFVLFEVDTRLGVDEVSFQSQFKPVIKSAVEQSQVVVARELLTKEVGDALQVEVNKIFEQLRKHTDVFVELKARPQFSLDKSVSFEILGKDQHGIENSLERRGSGMRRLLMVAFFKYLTEREQDGTRKYVFAVEEPENCLHPGLQRDLVSSFRTLADEGYQTIITSHSPVFAGASPIDDLALIIRNEGVAKAIQTPQIDVSMVAEELGVEPADQITCYNACIYVEGIDDKIFWSTVASKLKANGVIREDFGDKNVGFIISGGTNLKYWIDLRAMRKITRRFGVVVDSDKKNVSHNIPERKLNWKRTCETEGGKFFILRKREIENYIHPAALQRAGKPVKVFDEFTDMKKEFGENVFKTIKDMTSAEILEMDRYMEDGVEHHELKEIVEELLLLFPR